jgi:hypothetical protein
MSISPEEADSVIDFYDMLDVRHHGRLHRAGLIHVVATELGMHEEDVEAAVVSRYGQCDAAVANVDNFTGNYFI